MKIVYSGNPLIHKVSEEIKEFDGNLKDLSSSMFEEMYKEEGIGLAGIQVGIPKRILVINIPESKKDSDKIEEGAVEYERHGKFCMINPEITWNSEEKATEEEGCLSCPGVRADVERPLSIEAKYCDETGKKQNIKATDLLGRCIQHEIDHLNGILFIDYLSKIKKDMAYKKTKKYVKENEKI